MFENNYLKPPENLQFIMNRDVKQIKSMLKDLRV